MIMHYLHKALEGAAGRTSEWCGSEGQVNGAVIGPVGQKGPRLVLTEDVLKGYDIALRTEEIFRGEGVAEARAEDKQLADTKYSSL